MTDSASAAASATDIVTPIPRGKDASSSGSAIKDQSGGQKTVSFGKDLDRIDKLDEGTAPGARSPGTRAKHFNRSRSTPSLAVDMGGEAHLLSRDSIAADADGKISGKEIDGEMYFDQRPLVQAARNCLRRWRCYSVSCCVLAIAGFVGAFFLYYIFIGNPYLLYAADTEEAVPFSGPFCTASNSWSQQDTQVVLQLPGGEELIGAAGLSSTVSTADVLAIKKLLPKFSCDVKTFQHIPFAMPPTGPNRWRPPQPLPSPMWDGILDTTKAVTDSTCAQANDYGAIETGTSEDCLYLSVYAPADALEYGGQSAGGLKPVMIWIYGGGFNSGSSDLYDGSALAAMHDGIIVVTINYRLGIFGFFGADELRYRDSLRGSTGNYGIQDQRMAMKWVNQNIIAFGGDPENVMVFGQSAGAASTSIHTLLPESYQYFNKAGAASGGYSTFSGATWAERTALWPMFTLEKIGERLGCRVGHGHGKYSTTRRMLEDCFIVASTAEVMTAAFPTNTTTFINGKPDFASGLKDTIISTFGWVGGPWAPTVDCVEIKAHPWKLAAAGSLFNGPVIIGSNHDEAVMFGAKSASKTGKFKYDLTEAEWGSWLENTVAPQFSWPTATANHMPDIVDQIKTRYPPSNYQEKTMVDPEDISGMSTTGAACTTGTTDASWGCISTVSKYWQAGYHAMSDSRYSCAAHRGAEWLNQRGPYAGPVFHYLFHGLEFSPHSSEIPFYFLTEASSLTQKELNLSVTMAAYWTNFARFGDPNQLSADYEIRLPYWPEYDADEQTSVKFNGVYGETTDRAEAIGSTVNLTAASVRTAMQRDGESTAESEATIELPDAMVEVVTNTYSQGQCDFWSNTVLPAHPTASEEIAACTTTAITMRTNQTVDSSGR